MAAALRLLFEMESPETDQDEIRPHPVHKWRIRSRLGLHQNDPEDQNLLYKYCSVHKNGFRFDLTVLNSFVYLHTRHGSQLFD